MAIYIVRHADKEDGGYFNPLLRHQDPPLKPEGVRRAESLTDYFRGKPVTTLYASAYIRTQQTIEPLAKLFGLEPIIDHRLNEIDNGAFDTLSEEQIALAYPSAWQSFTERKADFRFPQGETGEEARERIVSFVEEKRLEHPTGDIVAVTHEGLIRILMCHVMDLPVYKRWNFSVDFCGITELQFQPAYGEWKLFRFNQVCG